MLFEAASAAPAHFRIISQKGGQHLKRKKWNLYKTKMGAARPSRGPRDNISDFKRNSARAIGSPRESCLSRGKRAVGYEIKGKNCGGGEKELPPQRQAVQIRDKRLPETVQTKSKTMISASRPLVATTRPKAGVPLPYFWVGGLLGI